MLIKDLFTRAVDRQINGVIKADQADSESVWQELDEYVVTKELDQRLRQFFDHYLASVDNPNDPTVVNKVGVWISGFFGSGKSHFIKILSYLLENKQVALGDKNRTALEFFEEKISDAMLASDVKRAVHTDVDVILFNIDSKADSNDERSILRAFLKVFNEKLGYCGDFPHIAHMERYLASQGQFDDFKSAIVRHAGDTWEQVRIDYQFNADEIAKALTEVTGQTINDADAWLDRYEKDFALSVENFAKWVKEYLDSKGSNHRIVFLVDEIGQYIGQDTQLMLNLQTIVENLGTACIGRAWVAVTSQEDIDAVLGDVVASKANDFSKIQGRFRRMSLSSANVDEVIEKRLLSKVDNAKGVLRDLYADKADILKHQLSFSNTGMTFKAYKDEEDFIAVYPFAPYQFQLVQKIFESIRKAGATGLHLAKGERSMLDAFQSAAKQVSDKQPGILVPLYRFYPAIESFLEGSVKAAIDNTLTNPSLEAFDASVLKTLFLIRYVDEIRGNIDNLITLFIDEIDADRRVLREKIEASLHRLEAETLINRNGEDFFFLTNEERDISREIANVTLTGSEDAKLVGSIIYEELIHSIRNGKFRYKLTNKDFAVNRVCDQYPFGTRTDASGLTVHIVTPLSDDYSTYNDATALTRSLDNDGQVLIWLADSDKRLDREVRTYLQTEKYAIQKSDGSQSSNFMKILKEFQSENLERKDRIQKSLDAMISEAKVFVAGKERDASAPTSSTLVDDSLNYLVENTFNHLRLLQHPSSDPQKDIKATLAAPDDSLKLGLQESAANKAALDDVLKHITISTNANRRLLLSDMTTRYAVRPYGWQEWDVVLLVVQLLKMGEISLSADGAALPSDAVYNKIDGTTKWKNIIVTKRKSVDKADLQKARQYAREVFGKMPRDGEDDLATDLRDELGTWNTKLDRWKSIQETGNYPGGDMIADALGITLKAMAIKDTYEFIAHFLKQHDDLMDASDDIHTLDEFFTDQKQVWDALQNFKRKVEQNKVELLKSAEAQAGLTRINEILGMPSPYGVLHEAGGLMQKVGKINDDLVQSHRDHAIQKIDGHISRVKAELEEAEATPDFSNKCLHPLQGLKQQVSRLDSIAHIFQVQQHAITAEDTAIDDIQRAVKEVAKQAERTKQAQAKKAQTQSEPTQPENKGLAEAEVVIEPPPVTVAVKSTYRPVKRITPKTLVGSKPYLETAEDVETYINTLRDQMLDAIENGDRVEIR